MKMRKMAIMAIALALLFLAIMAGAGNANAWDASVSSRPSTVISGETTTFTITVKNTGSDSIKVTDVGIRFDWMSEEGTYYFSEEVPEVIASGGEREFTVTVPIPTGIPMNVDHTGEIIVDASEPGILSDWGDPTSMTFSGHVIVSEPQPEPEPTTDDTSSDDTSDSPFLGIPMVLFGVMGSAAIFGIKRRKS